MRDSKIMRTYFSVLCGLGSLLLTCCGDDAATPADAGPRRDGGPIDRDGGSMPVDGSRANDAGFVGDAGPAEGPTARYVATHFVTPDADGTGDGSRENPWTWAQAYENAVAGNRVQFAPGQYDSPGNDEGRTFVFGPEHSGTEAEPIVFFAEYPAIYNPEPMHSLLYNDVPTRGLGTVTGARPGTTYVTWDGFSMRQGPNNVYGSEESVWSAWYSDHLRVLRCLFDQQGMGFDEGGANNWGAIFMQVVHHVEIADCIFRNIPGADENTATYLVYGVGEVEIHHSLFQNTWSNFNIKGVQLDAEYDLRPHRIHHNRLESWDGRMITLVQVGQGNRQPDAFCDFFQNVFVADDANLGIVYAPVSDDTPRGFRFVNNTFYGDTHKGADGEDQGFHTFFGAIPPGSQHWMDSLFQNNVVHITGLVTDLVHVSSGGAAMPELSRLAHGYNHYSPSFEDDDFAGDSLASWQAAGQDVGSLRGDPMFRDAAAGDLRLMDASPAMTAGRDVLQLLGGSADAPIPMGAYITPDQNDVIGVRPRVVTDSMP